MQYTIAEGDGIPFSYSVYRLQGDYRMGKTFQIKTELNQSMAYSMTQFSDKLTQSILDYSNNYRERPGYYPNRDSVDVQYYTQAQDKTGLECKDFATPILIADIISHTRPTRNRNASLMGTIRRPISIAYHRQIASIPLMKTVPHSS